jgi:hypothetical protein
MLAFPEAYGPACCARHRAPKVKGQRERYLFERDRGDARVACD